jgi:N-acetylmuramoyl-L-alanine amidase
MLKILFFLCLYTASYKGNKLQLSVKDIDGFRYIDIEPISQLLGSKINYLKGSGRIFWRKGDLTIVLIDGSPWVLLNGKPYNFPLSVRKQEDGVFLSPSMLIPLLKSGFNLVAVLEDDGIVMHDRKVKIEKVVIDAGHGGRDPGAIGLKKTKEKDDCILTRDKDEFIPLEGRTKIANQYGANLFVSIHLNACRSRKTHGCEVYFLSRARTDWERAVEARENSVIKFEERELGPNLESILWDLAQTEHLSESKDLAAYILESIAKIEGIKSNGVKQANFFVLRGAYMPAVLVEAEFLSNPKCEEKLKNKRFIRNIALGIVEGISKFKTDYEKRMNYE